MKKFWIGLLGIVMAMSMVACSNSPDTSGTTSGEGAASDQGSEMITVEDMKGTVSIPEMCIRDRCSGHWMKSLKSAQL